MSGHSFQSGNGLRCAGHLRYTNEVNVEPRAYKVFHLFCDCGSGQPRLATPIAKEA